MAVEPFPFPNEVYPADWFAPLEVDDWFDAPAHPLEIDLGCGDGSFLAKMGQQYPDRNFLGVERLLGRCRKVWKKADVAGLKNVKILRLDTNYAVKWLLPKARISRLHFLCPDPWPKKKHASRRQMCRMDFLRSIHDLLDEDGEFLFKTDSLEYFEEASEVQNCCDFFTVVDWNENDFYYPVTDFEQQWLDEGRTMNRMRLVKKQPDG